MKKIEELEGLLEELGGLAAGGSSDVEASDRRPVARRRIYTGQVAD